VAEDVVADEAMMMMMIMMIIVNLYSALRKKRLYCAMARHERNRPEIDW